MLLQKNRPLVLPAAHDALTARMIEAAGFPAYQIGGFALVGARYGQPDIDLIHLGERRAAVRDIMTGSSLPVLVDLDDGYGDAKNVTFAVRCMEAIRVSAIFIEDQQAPKKCGQMHDKHVIEPDEMVAKIRAAVEARSSPGAMFVVARTDALEAEGMRKALKRGERYLEAGADALYVEGPRSDDELREVARAFPGALLVTTMMEGGGETPWHPPAEFGEMGYSMILYPTSIIFRAARAMQRPSRTCARAAASTRTNR
ncbi:MAG: oxaloacetate decarboxylase [Myxococcales bacterium]